MTGTPEDERQILPFATILTQLRPPASAAP